MKKPHSKKTSTASVSSSPRLNPLPTQPYSTSLSPSKQSYKKRTMTSSITTSLSTLYGKKPQPLPIPTKAPPSPLHHMDQITALSSSLVPNTDQSSGHPPRRPLPEQWLKGAMKEGPTMKVIKRKPS